MTRDPAPPMSKRQAFELLGVTLGAEGALGVVAQAVGISKQAVHQWPDPLSQLLADRVIAAIWRSEHAAQMEAKRRWAMQQESRRAKV